MIETISTRQRFSWYERKEFKRLYRAQKVLIIEDFVANDVPIKDLAKKYDLPKDVIQAVIELYYKKPVYSITIMSNI